MARQPPVRLSCLHAPFFSHRHIYFVGHAVRGLCVLVLVAASTLIDAAYMQYAHPQRLFMVGFVYAAIALAILLGAQPWRVRDFFEWLFARPARVRVFGACFAAYGLVLCGVAFTY